MPVVLPPSASYPWDGEPGFFGMVRAAGCLAAEDTQMLLQAAAPSSSWYKSSASRLCLRGIQQQRATRQITPGPGLKHRAPGKPWFASLGDGRGAVPKLQWHGLLSQRIAGCGPGPPAQQDELPRLLQSVVHPNKMWARWEGECPRGVWGHQLLGTVSNVSLGCFVSLR